MAVWRDALHPLRHAARCSDFRADLGPGQHAALAGFGALAELELNHFDLRLGRVPGKFVGIEAAIGIAAAEITRADFPNQVATVDFVMHGNRPLPRVMRKTTALGTGVERQNRVGRQGPKAHGRDVENAGAVRLGATAILIANADAKVVRV